MKDTTNKSAKGGARAGAGRPKVNRELAKSYTISLLPSQAKTILTQYPSLKAAIMFIHNGIIEKNITD
jgi:hypothetical protein